MAFTSVLLRRASSSILPIAIRSVASRRPISDEVGIRQFIPLLRFSKAASEIPAADVATHLIGVLDSEIIHSADQVHDIPDGFPFEIQGSTRTSIFLIRKYHDEIIEVNAYGYHDNQNQNAEESNVPSSRKLLVQISKGDDHLLFGVNTTYPNEIAIENVRICSPSSKAQQYFNNLDENLQKAFREYLEIRGITPSFISFLFDSIRNKDKTKYFHWLKNVKVFMEK